MNAMALSRLYFRETAEPQFKAVYPDLYAAAAAGLVGNGSECFGFDDDISRDHDWGIDFFIWLPDEHRGDITALQGWKDALLRETPPQYTRTRSEYGARLGVMTVGDFYASLIGYPSGPDTIADWRRIPEDNLAMATNGEIFVDINGTFTAVRDKLLLYYPEDLRLKKLAARCMAIAQTGQYNVRRCFLRGDDVTLRTVLTRFTDNVISAVFLLNKVFKPYYKWAYKKMTGLPILGAELSPYLKKLARSGIQDDNNLAGITDIIDIICSRLIDALRSQNLAHTDDWFLTTHAEEIQQHIQDPFLRSLPTQYE